MKNDTETKKKSITARFSEELVNQLKLIYPHYSRESIKKLVNEECKKRVKVPNVVINNKTKSLLSLINYIERDDETQPIISGWGTLFKQHSIEKSPEYQMVQDFIDLRKVAKKNKFEHINDVNKTLFNMYDIFQLTYKLLNNSYYGAAVESNSFFFHPEIGPSITQSGVVVITTSINLFEKFLSSNIFFRNFQDITTYISNILKEDYDIWKYINEDYELTVEEVFNFFKDRVDSINDNEEESLISILNNLNYTELVKVYLKNNLYVALDNSERLQNDLCQLLGNEDFLDPNNPPEEYLSYLNDMWDVLETIVHYNYMDFYRYDNALNRSRKCILTIDTDSNFLYLFPFFQYCLDNYELEDTPIIRMTTTNIIMYILTSLIAKCFEMLTKKFNIQDEEQRKIIAMKNEFFYSRIMLTNAKKNYSGIVTLQEGNILNNPKHDIKGLAIKKTSTNKTAREVFSSVLKEDILLSDNIDVIKIIHKYDELEETIRNSLNEGSTEFAVPDKVNDIQIYKTPFQIQSVRGTLLWNALYPSETISFPDKVNKLALNTSNIEFDGYLFDGTEYENVMNILDYLDETYELEDNIEEVKEVLNNTIYKNENVSKYGLSVICFPKSVKTLPYWLVPFIDIDSVIELNMKPGYKILESLDINILSTQVNGKERNKLSNIINI